MNCGRAQIQYLTAFTLTGCAGVCNVNSFTLHALHAGLRSRGPIPASPAINAGEVDNLALPTHSVAMYAIQKTTALIRQEW